MRIKISEKKHIISCIILFALIVLALIFINQKDNSKYNQFSDSKEMFGTIFAISLYSENHSESVLKDICEKLFHESERLEKIFSATLSDSELNIVNNTAYDTEVKVSDELFFVLEKSLYYCEQSSGAFDITIGNIINLWDISGGNTIIPSSSEIDLLKNTSNWKNIILDKEEKTVKFTSKDVNINLGAIAKGYAGDVLKNMLTKEFEITHALLNLGGNIVAIGSKPNGDNWNIGIKNPLNISLVVDSVAINDKSVVTSGNYERYFEIDGMRYHHILNPFTGYPADSGIISSTIIGPSSTDCDALSTACYILGLENSLNLINSLNEYEAIFIDNSGSIYKTEGLAQ